MENDVMNEAMNWKSILCEQRYKDTDSALPVDNQFEQDFYEIITSPSFRRLQDKTQVFSISKNDFVRTRLTHSVEVATLAGQIGKKIWKLIKADPDLSVKYGYDYDVIDRVEDVLKCAGLLHDIGNPPLGHNGEFVIRKWFKDYLEAHPDLELTEQMRMDLMNFEGNAQALRVVSKLHHSRGTEEGMNLTYAVISSIIKYPVSSLELDDNPKGYDKIGYYHADEELFERCRNMTGIKPYQRNPLTFILEAADDIGYVIADVEDSVSNDIIDFVDIYKAFEGLDDDYYRDTLTGMAAGCLSKEQLRIALEQNDDGERHDKCRAGVEAALAFIRTELMNHSADNFVKYYEQIMNGTFTGDLIDPDGSADEIHVKIVKALKRLVKEKVYPHRDSQREMYVYRGILEKYFAMFVPVMLRYDRHAPGGITEIPGEDPAIRQEYIHILQWMPGHLLDVYNDSIDRITAKGMLEGETQTAYELRIRQEKNYLGMLSVTDYVSGMTDRFAFQNFAKN